MITAQAGNNAEGDTVKDNDMPDKQAHYKQNEADYKTDDDFQTPRS